MTTSLKITSSVAQKLLDLGILVYDLADDRCKLAPNLEAMGWEISLGFEHVAIKQKKNMCSSRLSVSTESEIIKGVKRPIPMIAANMSTVCNADFCIQLYKAGALGVMHRAAPEQEILDSITKIAEECKWVAGSVGVGESQIELANKMIDSGCNIIFIDIAHGYSDSVIDTGRNIKDSHSDVKIVIGNTTNINLLYESKDFIDSAKVGIAQGAACETKNTAGCTEKQFSVALKFKEISKQLNIPIISDGGIREPSDMVKAIGAGANSIMAGSIFARCPESAAPWIDTEKGQKRIYAGMACYSHDSEILTASGWKLFKDLAKDDEVATLNPQTNNFEYQKPTRHYEFDYKGKMVRAKSLSIDLLVTPNHRMYVAKRHSVKGRSDFKFVNAEDCINNGAFIYQKTSNWTGKEQENFKIEDFVQTINRAGGKTYEVRRRGLIAPMAEWVDFFGFWLAEGSTTKKRAHGKKSKFYNEKHFGYDISISNNNIELIHHYKNMLVSWGLNPHLRTRGKNHELIIRHMSLFMYLKQFGKAHEKFIPANIKQLSPSLLKILINSIYLGDGAKARKQIYTSSTKFRDDIMEIAIKAGYSPAIHLSNKKGTESCINGRKFVKNYDSWAIYIGKFHKNPQLGKQHHKYEDYDGKVYCVEVPNGIVCVRKNMQYVWCGNSRFVQDQWRGGLKDGTCPEGGVRYLDLGEPLAAFLTRWTGALKSGITYAGGWDIQSFQKNVEFIRLAQ